MSTIPTIIFHVGHQDYLFMCLRQALFFDNEVHLIGDNVDYIKKRIKHSKFHIVDFQKYNELSRKFRPIYKHFSSNPFELELICIMRWMYIYQYMKEENIEKAFICDSDVLLYSNINDDIQKHFPGDMYLCTSGSKNVTGGQSFFTLDKLHSFVEFCFSFYETQIPKIEMWHPSYKDDGGICDMTLLYYFAHNVSEFVGLRLPELPYFENDLTKVMDDTHTFDLHIGVSGNHTYPNDYEMIKIGEFVQIKKIHMKDGIPYCFNVRLKKFIRFNLLHFQGGNKQIMRHFYVPKS